MQPILNCHCSGTVILSANDVLICRQREGNSYEQQAYHEKNDAPTAQTSLLYRDSRLAYADHHQDHAASEENGEKVGHKEEEGTHGCTHLTTPERDPDHAQWRHERDGDCDAAQRVGDFGTGYNEGASRARSQRGEKC